MKLNRRGFLGALGIGTVAGKGVVAKVAADPSVLNLQGLAGLGGLAADANEIYSDGPVTDRSYRMDWALKKLAKKKARDFFAINQEKKDFYVHSLDPDTHALRSMSLVNKMRRTRDIQYAAKDAREDITLNRIIAGFED